ncbi:hypothetical protein HYPSUDRAFT_119124, partial [Hypholoma sublateritium FD-334 SS-4]
MIEELEQCISVSHDLPDAPSVILEESVYSGQQGWPTININPSDLAMMAAERTSMQALGDLYQCGTRTIRHCMLKYGLLAPSPPVYVSQQQEDGTIYREYMAGKCANLSNLTDDELDATMISIYEQFSSFGRRMIDGYLMALGKCIPCQRIHDSYLQVIGPPVGIFVIHAFIDGYSRFLLGIHASNNNCATTVLNLFEDIVEIYGCPNQL